MNLRYLASVGHSLCLAACLFVASNIFAGNVIFDLGGVCIQTSKAQGFKKLIGSLLKAPSRIIGARNFMLSFLHSIMDYEPGMITPCDDEGKPMPRIMHAYMTGELSSQEIRTLIRQKLTCDTKRGYAEKQLLLTMTDIPFVPENLIDTQILHPNAHDLVRACKKRGHNVYVLSNWDNESFNLLQQKYPEFFAEFDGIVISGNVGLAKPNPAIYEYIIIKYNLDPNMCVFLDDQIANIEAAQKYGMTGIRVTQTKFLFSSSIDLKNARKKLRTWERKIGFEPIQV